MLSSSHRISRRNSQRFELFPSSSLISSLFTSAGSSQRHNFHSQTNFLSPLPSPSSQHSLLEGVSSAPTFTTEPYGAISFSNVYGGVVPCTVSFGSSKEQQLSRLEKIYWEVRDVRSHSPVEVHHDFTLAGDISGLRETRPDGSLAFYPFSAEGALQATELHNALYRCVAETVDGGRLASRSILVTMGKFLNLV